MLCRVTSSSSSFRETKLIRDGGSGKLLLECCATGKRRHNWVVYNAKGDEVLHVQLRRPSWWQRLRQRGADAGGPQAPQPPLNAVCSAANLGQLRAQAISVSWGHGEGNLGQLWAWHPPCASNSLPPLLVPLPPCRSPAL